MVANGKARRGLSENYDQTFFVARPLTFLSKIKLRICEFFRGYNFLNTWDASDVLWSPESP